MITHPVATVQWQASIDGSSSIGTARKGKFPLPYSSQLLSVSAAEGWKSLQDRLSCCMEGWSKQGGEELLRRIHVAARGSGTTLPYFGWWNSWHQQIYIIGSWPVYRLERNLALIFFKGFLCSIISRSRRYTVCFVGSVFRNSQPSSWRSHTRFMYHKVIMWGICAW